MKLSLLISYSYKFVNTLIMVQLFVELCPVDVSLKFPCCGIKIASSNNENAIVCTCFCFYL